MAVTSQRPVIGPGSGVAFAFVAGKFLWSLDGSHEEILHALTERAVPHQAARDGVWGWVKNESHSQEPQYSVELYSDLFGVPQNQQHVQDCYDKLEAYLHQFTVVTPQAGQALPFSSSWKRESKATLFKHREYFLDGKRYIYHGLAFPGTFEAPKLWAGDINFDHLFLDPETKKYRRVDHDEMQALQGQDLIYQVPDTGYGKSPDEWKNEEIRRTPEESAEEWPDTLPWKDDEQDWYRRAKWTHESADGTMGDMNPTGTLQSSLEASPAASAAYQALTQAGGQVYIVGGAVRDSMMGKDPKDIDMMCSGLDEDQMELALQGVGRLDFTGKQFGVFRLRVGNDEVEIALPRTERSTGSGHKEFEVTTDPHLPVEADLSRRDFTWNAMAYDPSTQSLIDPHGGQNDLVNGRMALVNETAFEDDPLRIVRAMVATARYGFEPDPSLLKSMSDNASSIRHLPGERIQMEFDKLLSAPNPVAAMELAENTGLLDYICPELSSTVGFDQQNPHHNLNVWDHTMAVLANMTRLSNDPDMRLAALFHDSGKPEAFWVDPNAPKGGGGHFYRKIQDDGTPIGHDHEDLGAQNVRAFMERLRYPTKRIDRVEKLVQLHMFPYFKSLKGARKFLQAAGDEKTAFDLLTLRECDAGGKDGITPKDFDANMLNKGRDLLQQVLEASHAVSVKDLDIGGKDLIDIGFKPGPEIGQTLNNLLDLVMEDPSLNEKDKLLQKVRELR